MNISNIYFWYKNVYILGLEIVKFSCVEIADTFNIEHRSGVDLRCPYRRITALRKALCLCICLSRYHCTFLPPSLLQCQWSCKQHVIFTGESKFCVQHYDDLCYLCDRALLYPRIPSPLQRQVKACKQFLLLQLTLHSLCRHLLSWKQPKFKIQDKWCGCTILRTSEGCVDQISVFLDVSVWRTLRSYSAFYIAPQTYTHIFMPVKESTIHKQQYRKIINCAVAGYDSTMIKND